MGYTELTGNDRCTVLRRQLRSRLDELAWGQPNLTEQMVKNDPQTQYLTTEIQKMNKANQCPKL